MNSRRSFFARCGAAIATIALAPELAFRAKLALPEVEKVPYLIYACNEGGIYEQLLECELPSHNHPADLARVNLDEVFRIAYEMKKARQKAGISENYFLVKIET